MADLQTLTLRLGPPADALRLSSQLLDQFGNPVAGAVAWSSSAPAVASVDGLGNVTPLALGTTLVTATGPGGVAASVNVNVIGLPVPTSVVIGVASDT